MSNLNLGIATELNHVSIKSRSVLEHSINSLKSFDKIQNQPSSPKSASALISSSARLKTFLTETSEKLKAFGCISEKSKTIQSSNNLPEEISILNSKILCLERERDILLEENQKLSTFVKESQDFLRNQADFTRIVDYAQTFSERVKKNPDYFRSFHRIFGNEELMLNNMKRNANKSCMDLLKFILSNITTDSTLISPFSASDSLNSTQVSLNRSLTKSSNPLINFNLNKEKIQRISENLTKTLEKSKTLWALYTKSPLSTNTIY